MDNQYKGGRNSSRPHSGGRRPAGRGGASRPFSSNAQRGSRGSSNYSGGMNTDDIGDTIITVGTDTSDAPDTKSKDSSGSFDRPKYASDRARSSYTGGARRGSSSSEGGDRSRAWSSSSSARGGSSSPRSGGSRFGGGSRGGSSSRGGDYGGSRGGSRSGGGGGRGGGRRFKAPEIDIERFIEKSTREIGEQRALAALMPAHVVTNDFNALITNPKLRAQVAEKGYVTPTPIQDKAIPHVRDRKDIVGIANTGTGKTAAFLLPLIDRALVHEHERTLIVVPTRELATQIGDEFRGFSRGLGISAAVVIGGANIRPQITSVRNARFVIGTPGRLKDLIERRALDMKSFTAIVLDEADRMLDMGFIPDIRFLMERMHHDRHSLCFSATMPPEIERLINEFLKDPISVSTKTGTTSHSIEQSVIRITEGSSKLALLEEILRGPEFDKVIVFGETKHGVERLSKQLALRGVRAESIHGNKSSNQRKRSLDAFKSGRVRVLVATDVAARGLDITDVSHVINFDVPHSYEDYVHRIGRTGRAGATGKAVTFVGGSSH